MGEPSLFQQASESVHDEARVGRVPSSSLKISQEVEIETGCVVSVSYLPYPLFAPASPGPGKKVGRWTRLVKTARSGSCFFQGALRGEGVLSALSAAGDWVKKGSYHTAWSVPCDRFLPCSCSYLCVPRHSDGATNC